MLVVEKKAGKKEDATSIKDSVKRRRRSCQVGKLVGWRFLVESGVSTTFRIDVEEDQDSERKH
jgi:hypothetical protein